MDFLLTSAVELAPPLVHLRSAEAAIDQPTGLGHSNRAAIREVIDHVALESRNTVFVK